MIKGILGIIVLIGAWAIVSAAQPVTAVAPQPITAQESAQVGYIVATPTFAPPTNASPPTRITMPEIGLDAAIESAAITQTPAYNVGWWPDSQQRGDVVLFGHNYAALAPLAAVQPGQQMTLDSAAGERVYTVTRLETRPANGNVPEAVVGQVVLITCLPFPNGDAERLIVYAEEVSGDVHD
ncbi:MAG: class F sortase [Chloroflexi bacterium]|nr:class F sortase [Chloroflexota bacterium]MBP7042360.1 class F sortase [Chloroflexota bacterium]